MKTISHPVFISVFLAYFIYYVLKLTNVEMPELVTSYLADILSLFIVNTIILWLIRTIKTDKLLELKLSMVIVSFLLFTLFFEFYLPAVNKYYHRDYLDILCYAASALGFVLWRRKQMQLK